MNIELFPEEIKNDIEDQSLSILEKIKDEIIVIGGWAVRAIIGKKHGRYTLDVDGVATLENIEKIKSKLIDLGMDVNMNKWGIQFYVKYTPKVDFDEEIHDKVDEVELRIEVSQPLIKESQTHHFFEFDLENYEERALELSYR